MSCGPWAWDPNHSDYESLIPFRGARALPDIATRDQSLSQILSKSRDSYPLGGKRIRVS